jgi:hypothetical protein
MKYKLEFTVDEVKFILGALYKLPYEQVAKFVESIVNEINKQEQQRQEELVKKEGNK